MAKRFGKARIALAAALAAAVLAPCGLRVRARWIVAPVEVPVLFYPSIGAGAGDVRADLFYLQMRDLAQGSFSPVRPGALARWARWGLPLPQNPVLVYVGSVSPEAAASVSETLDEYGFAAVVGSEIAEKEGIALSGAQGVARIGGGRGADALGALPSIVAAAGDMSFSVRVFRDSKDPASFGTLRVSQPTGKRMPLSVIAYRPQDDSPFAQLDVPELPGGENGDDVGIELGADISFPLEVMLYDQSRTLLYHDVMIAKSAVVKPSGWREPVSDPGREIDMAEF